MQLHKLNILYVEPFYSGSHKRWIDAYKKYSKHNIDILSLPGRKWKWRMHGGAISLAEEFNLLNKKFDLIICSDMLNLPVFKSLCKNNLKNEKVVMYFHENQLSYPWSPKDQDTKLNRDLSYYYINYTSSLLSDYNFFNSQYHIDSYINGLKKYLKKMPDFQNYETIDVIHKKSEVLPIGCELNQINNFKTRNKNSPIILWNHRWEYDKNPESFFNTLFDLDKKGIEFSLVVLGESYEEYPEIFDIAKVKLKNKILYFGYCKSNDEYKKWLKKCDILPVTSIQDFFGISIVEAVAYGNYPILPNRLSYPEIFNINKRPELFYNNLKELKEKLISVIKDNRCNKNLSNNIIKKYDWSNLCLEYDKKFESIIN